MTKIRVGVVDDSSFIRKAVVRMLSPDKRLEVVGVAASGEELLANVEAWQPDVIVLDLSMPGIGGLQTLDRIMERFPTPVIILSSYTGERASLTIEALHRGALDFIDKSRYSLVDFKALREVLLEKILLVTGSVASDSNRAETVDQAPLGEAVDYEGAVEVREVPSVAPTSFDLLLIGASTGGPLAIRQILEDLGSNLRIPAVIVQHMPRGFTKAFAERLNRQLPCAVHEAGHQDQLMPSTVYVAPAEYHLRIERSDGRLAVSLSREPEDATHRPAIDILFSSAARIQGLQSLGLLLTGMGNDGAQGLKDLAAHGAWTLAQDEGSSIVYGMPRAAVELGAVREVLPLDDLGSRLRELLDR